MADLITKLLLDSKQFDNNLAKSTREVQSFQKGINSMKDKFSGALNTVGKFIPQLAAISTVVGAGKVAFEGINNASQKFSDGLDILKNQVKSVNDGVWNAVANGGSISTFIDKLGDLKKVAEQTSIALDALGSAELFSAKQFDYWFAQAQTALASGDKEVAKQYLQNAVQANNVVFDRTLESMTAKLNESVVKASTHLDSQILIPKYNVDDIEKLMGISENDLDAVGEKYQRQIEEIFRKETKVQTNPYGEDLVTSTFVHSAEERAKMIQELNSRIGQDPLGMLAYFRSISNESENTISQVLADFAKIQQTEVQISKLEKRINAETTGDSKQKALTKIDTPIIGTSIKELEQQLAVWKKAYENAGDDTGRAYAQKMINSINAEISTAKTPGIKDLGDKIKNDFAGWSENIAKGNKELTTTNNTVKATSDDMATMNAMMGIMSTTMAATGENGAASFASILSAIIPVISAVGALAVAEGAEKGVKTSRNWIEAVVAVTTLVGTIAAAIAAGKNKAKYANGGIVQSFSNVGDQGTVRVNGGEMILNGSQQANLFRLLNSGNFDNSSKITGDVEFKIKGNELVGVLNNYNRKTSRVI